VVLVRITRGDWVLVDIEIGVLHSSAVAITEVALGYAANG
jgi:hypothetical protein